MGLKPTEVLETVERPNRGVEYGGGRAEVLRSVKVMAQIGVRTEPLWVDVVRGFLLLLLSEGAMHAFGFDLITSKRRIQQRGKVLAEWSEGEMPAVQVLPAGLATVEPADEGAEGDAVEVGVDESAMGGCRQCSGC